nr:type VI secretion system tip protein TssI/VgrG [uncultured Rhodopila sp.]
MSDTEIDSTRSGQLLSLQTALGQGALLATSFHAEESISAPYCVTVEVISGQAVIDPDAVLFQPACLTITFGTGASRIMQGMVRSFVATGEPVRDQYAYTLTFVPKLWFMGQTRDCRIFANMAIADILTTICGEAGQTISVNVYGDKAVQPYVTQFNETDFAFFSRLVEAAGYFYYFTHASGDHTLVVTDQNQGFVSNPTPSLTVSHEGGGTDVLTAWHKIGSTAHGSFHLLDYDLTQPDTLPEATKATTLKASGAGKRDVFEWPALALKQPDVAAKARLNMEAAEAEASLIEALGADPAFMPGTQFIIAIDPYSGAEGVQYVIRSVSSSGHDEGWVAGGGASHYANRIVAFPSTVTWREKLVTPRPVMAGIHSAVVIGDSGEEIHSEQYARVKVSFFWDHRKDVTADNGIWVRLIQPWAGNTWGWQSLPRVGTEVAVGFFDGDPDRPVIVGGLYNADMMPVFPIPAQQNKTGLRTRSTKGGSSSTFSEFSVDDTTGSELVFLHAEKDMFTEIENNETVTVGNNQSITITNDRTLTVKAKETIEVDDSQTVTIKNGRTTTVDAAGDSLTVNNGGIKVTASQSDIAIAANAGNVTVTAMNSIKLTVGGNSIEINNEGITISAIKVSVQGQAMVQIQGPMVQASADAMMTLKGGVMMLN